ncbi:hypothetical protein [Almyronema epifaneia]|uniref:Uncharacterized protein n=1 Tax=Almyronema epifaneia S1 TaxID=2991925 RepID=A0ABW6ILK3_9CYAN
MPEVLWLLDKLRLSGTVWYGFGHHESSLGQPSLSSDRIARNYILQTVRLEAVAYCEEMVAQLDLDEKEQLSFCII